MPEFDEQEHPRDEYGRFVYGPGAAERGEGRGGEREYEGGYASKPKPSVERYYGWERLGGTGRSFRDRRADQLDACLDSLRSLERRMDAVEWEEHKHPRDNDGKFATKAGGGAGPKIASNVLPSRKSQIRDGGIIKQSVSTFSKALGGSDNPYSLLDKHGRQYLINEDTYKGKRGFRQQCYRNATNMALRSPDKYTYVEGIMTVHGIPIEHAWVVDKKGNVIDPTMREQDARIVGSYYGIPFRSDYLEKTVYGNGIYSLLRAHNRGIYSTPAGEYLQEGSGGEVVSQSEARYMPHSETPATSLLEQHKTPTIEEFIASLPADEQRHVRQVTARLRQGVSTDASVDRGGFRQPNSQFTPERQKLHENIIKGILSPEKVKAARPTAGEAPTFTVLGGRAGSGKSLVTKKGQGPVDAERAIVIDSDLVKSQLPGYEGWNAALYHEEASHVIEQAMRMAQKLKFNIVLDGTMKSFAPMQDRLEGFKKAGYRLEGYYVFAPPAVAAKRAVVRSMRGERRFVSPDYVLGSTSNERSFDGLRNYFNKWEVYDNSGDKPVKKFYGGQ